MKPLQRLAPLVLAVALAACNPFAPELVSADDERCWIYVDEDATGYEIERWQIQHCERVRVLIVRFGLVVKEFDIDPRSLMASLRAPVLNVGPRSTIATLVLVARVAQPSTKRLARPAAVGARLWGGAVVGAVSQKDGEPPILRHVTSPTEDRDVLGLIVPGVPVPVVPVDMVPGAASLASLGHVPPSSSSPFGFGARRVALPRWMVGAADCPTLLSPVLDIWAGNAEPPQIYRARLTKASTKGLVGTSTIRACPHGGNLAARVPQAKENPGLPEVAAHG